MRLRLWCWLLDWHCVCVARRRWRAVRLWLRCWLRLWLRLRPTHPRVGVIRLLRLRRRCWLRLDRLCRLWLLLPYHWAMWL